MEIDARGHQKLAALDCGCLREPVTFPDACRAGEKFSVFAGPPGDCSSLCSGVLLRALPSNRRQLRQLPARVGGVFWRLLGRRSLALLILLATAISPVQAQVPDVSVCSRTEQVRAAIVAEAGVGNCVDVTDDQLAQITSLGLSGEGVRALQAGDFAGLAALEVLLLDSTGLTELPPDLFSGLTALRELRLNGNSLTALPAGVFSKLRALQSLFLEDNPGSAYFLPIAHAGTDQTTVGAGQIVTLTTIVSNADPWGDNVAYAWAQTDNSSSTVVLMDAATARPSFVMPADAAGELEFELTVTGRGTGLDGARYASTDSVIVADVRATEVAVSSHPVVGDIYFLGEAIELTLTFNRPAVVDATGGTPSIELDIGGGRRRADYVRGSDSRQLVFAYTVQLGDEDTNGIRVCGAGQLAGCTGAISLNRGAIEGRDGIGVSLGHPTQAEQSGHKVNGSQTGLSGGICGRTKAVRDALVELISAAADCSQVTVAQLESLTGRLSLGSSGVATLKPGDFAALVSLEHLFLSGNSLVALPVGIFSNLTALQELRLNGNNLAALPVGALTGLASLEFLFLGNNRLTALPGTTFNGLGVLRELSLQSNRLTKLPPDAFFGLNVLRQLSLSANSLEALPPNIFSGLVLLELLYLNDNSLTEFSEDTFNGLRALQQLSLQNNRLAALPVGAFDGLSALLRLWLHGNDLAVLPAAVFSDLRALQFLFLQGNPGSADFLPIANAGADQIAEAGQSVTLRATASDADPWGDNVAYAWAQTDTSGSVVNLTGAGTDQLSFVMPANAAGELEFELTVTGRGTGLGGARYADAASVMVRFVAVPDTVVTLSGPVPAATTNIDQDELSLVYSYSAADLRGRVLTGSIEVAAAVDGVTMTSAVRVDERSGERKITIVLRRETYPSPGEHLLAVTLSLSPTAAGFVLGQPSSTTTAFNFLPLSRGETGAMPTENSDAGTIGDGRLGGMDAATILLAVLLFFASFVLGPTGGRIRSKGPSRPLVTKGWRPYFSGR